MHPPSLRLLRTLRALENAHVPLKTSQHNLRIRRRALGRSLGDRSSLLGNNQCPAHSFTTSTTCSSSPISKSSDRGPVSSEDTQTDFGSMNVLGNTPAPTTAIDACLHDGFHLENGLKISGGSGCLLVAGEAFSWRPWDAGMRGTSAESGRMINTKGQWNVENEAWGVLDLMWPKPDLLILGLGPHTHPISPETRRYINSLGIRVDIQDTRNAAAQFNLLATERGVGTVAAALVPMGWKEPRQ